MMSYYMRDVPDQPPLWSLEGPQLEFALRRHNAKSLHWDLRIKARGTLYSWYTLRPPSFDPMVVVRAHLQEPHDPRYLYSERRIPEGRKGAGPTLVEDCGRCRPVHGGTDSQDSLFHEAFVAGKIDLAFDAHILHGEFRLERYGSVWGLRKLPDAHAASGLWPWTGRSILTDLSLDDL